RAPDPDRQRQGRDPEMSPALVSALAAATAITGVIAVYQILSDLLLRDRSRASDRIDEEFLRKRKEQAKRSPLFKNLGKVAAEVGADGEDMTLRQKFELMVEQSGMEITPGRLAGISVGAGLALGATGLIVRGSIITALIGLAIGLAVPIMYVKRKRNARM